uniref:Uncharacterized protein n=1 Tax=Percolomonas cosmopolitus TaxID=63605 RepID=A0A7S1KLJ2_9EUKA
MQAYPDQQQQQYGQQSFQQPPPSNNGQGDGAEPVNLLGYVGLGLLGLLLGFPGTHNFYLAITAPRSGTKKVALVKGLAQLILGSIWTYIIVWLFIHLLISLVVECIAWFLLFWTIVIPPVVLIVDILIWIITIFLWVLYVPIWIWCLVEIVLAGTIVRGANGIGNQPQPQMQVNAPSPAYAQPQQAYSPQPQPQPQQVQPSFAPQQSYAPQQ